MLFNQRNGYKTLKELDPQEISSDLRNSLWNEITEWVEEQSIEKLCLLIWKYYYKKPTDKIPYRYHDPMDGYLLAWTEVREKFFGSNWNNTYDFLEFLLAIDQHKSLENAINRIFKRELAPYTVIDKQIIQITDPIELEAISQSLNLEDQFSPASKHIQAALTLLSNRIEPDYRNSIKESISAVEAMARIISKKPKASLDEALKTIESSFSLHKGLKKGYSSLYGYTSDSNGIRHSILEEPKLTQADAKYFLISCSAFVNYLKALSHQPLK